VNSTCEDGANVYAVDLDADRLSIENRARRIARRAAHRPARTGL
jgi:hypothetical protein